jgi:hypothetical protein
MTTKRTWLWIVVGAAVVFVVVLTALAGSGVYFVTHHIRSERSTSADALRAFDAVSASLGSPRPLYELDAADEPRLVRSLAELPAGASHPDTLYMLAWDPDQSRLVRVSLPFWLLRIGRHKVRVMREANGFDFQRLNLDVDELERIGPALVFDFRNQDGVRVLLWTQ